MTEPAPTPPAVELCEVAKRFGDHVVLDRLSLEVADAQKVVIIGPSGSGKTTILRTVMTLERPDSGRVRLGGRDLYHVTKGDKLVRAPESHVREVRREASMVFQHFNLFPHLTVRRNITLGLRRSRGMGREESDERARSLLDRVGLLEMEDRHPGSLSGGQKQRVAIARALAMEPRVMLFDEVTSALDPELVGEVLAVLRDIAHDSGMAMLIVTHEMRFAEEIADRVLMFDQGRVVEDRPPKEMFSAPREARTQAFLEAVLRR